MNTTTIKANGVHYTPPGLAGFLAAATVEQIGDDSRDLVILDPACGNGALLLAVAEALPARMRRRAKLVGYEMDGGALEQANHVLHELGVKEIVLDERDFLES